MFTTIHNLWTNRMAHMCLTADIPEREGQPRARHNKARGTRKDRQRGKPSLFLIPTHREGKGETNLWPRCQEMPAQDNTVCVLSAHDIALHGRAGWSLQMAWHPIRVLDVWWAPYGITRKQQTHSQYCWEWLWVLAASILYSLVSRSYKNKNKNKKNNYRLKFTRHARACGSESPLLPTWY